MESLVDFALQERYKQVKDLGDRLGELATLIEWEPFREIVGELYTNTTEYKGRPNIDVVLMIKLIEYFYLHTSHTLTLQMLNKKFCLVEGLFVSIKMNKNAYIIIY